MGELAECLTSREKAGIAQLLRRSQSQKISWRERFTPLCTVYVNSKWCTLYNLNKDTHQTLEGFSAVG